MNWIKTSPGVLVLEGTIMSIVYRPGSVGDFCVYQGDRYLWRCVTLSLAKIDAQRRSSDLIEIGAQ